MVKRKDPEEYLSVFGMTRGELRKEARKTEKAILKKPSKKKFKKTEVKKYLKKKTKFNVPKSPIFSKVKPVEEKKDKPPIKVIGTEDKFFR